MLSISFVSFLLLFTTFCNDLIFLLLLVVAAELIYLGWVTAHKG